MVVEECFCAPGTHGAATGLCTGCNKGMWSSGGPPCQKCAAGTFGPYTLTSSCTDCGVGTYQASSGATVCSACEKGKTTKETKQTEASACLCKPGTYEQDNPNDYGTKICTPCSGGKYSSGIGDLDCSECDAGTYTPHSGGTCEDGHPTKNDHPRQDMCKMKVQDDKVTQDKWKDAKDCKELTAQWKSQADYDVEDKDTLAADGDLREWCCLCAQEHPPGGKVLGSSKCSMCSRYIRAHAYKHVNSYLSRVILPGYLESSFITVGIRNV